MLIQWTRIVLLFARDRTLECESSYMYMYMLYKKVHGIKSQDFVSLASYVFYIYMYMYVVSQYYVACHSHSDFSRLDQMCLER